MSAILQSLLNGAKIPSPDLTRNVIPLDIFPTAIVESLRVQKAWSPDLPANFGGGNVDIRTRSIPDGFLFQFEVGTGYNDLNSRRRPDLSRRQMTTTSAPTTASRQPVAKPG